MSSRSLSLWIVAAAVLWQAVAAVAPGWARAQNMKHGSDFASYYYAAVVAEEGGDPYRPKALTQRAREEGRRGAVHPFFYPPPFLLATVWAPSLDLHSAFLVWYWLDVLATLVVTVLLWRWLAPLHETAGPIVAIAVAAMTAVANNHIMGQANLPVLAMALSGLWATDRDRPWLGGALMGCACMAKMSPALFVAWWLLQRRWKPVVAACTMAVVLSLVSLPIVDFATQQRFYIEVLPGFASGNYNGLSIPISLYGNHSIPNLWDQVFPSDSNELSAAAGWGARVCTLTLVATLGVAFVRPTEDRWQRAGQAAAIAAALLLVPVYTYEHHLVWALPTLSVAALGVVCGRLPRGWAVAVGFAATILCFDQQLLKKWSKAQDLDALGWLIQESKFGALVVVLVACVLIGRSQAPEETHG